ncbi:type II toxin-antitoxin system RelE family toxin [Fulvivirga lutea]|uniref:Type II toxin-antitoxin system RelE/ParE family toxin n=1 Tax=Fulvivirga lutea TaxID=2810512 RepID=A0A974ZZZ3_9BACT|nr:type II toxin-antitoxin system RelE/ParE family toxin [Fulvivirga lutea]QSE96281.1 type II toxin-antitoxin system RelE/ParE family toxin [Fulvivirga lutea]
MLVIFLKSFLNDIKKINDAKLKQRLKTIIEKLESEESLEEIANLKKLRGHPTAYRIRLGDYRIGLFYDQEEVKLVRFLKRSDIYKLFP